MENLFIKMLDRRGRVLWGGDGNDPARWDKPLIEYVSEDGRENAEECFYRCIIKGEAVEFRARWFCPILEATVGWCLTQLHPIPPDKIPGIACLAVQSLLHENIEEFTEADRELLNLLAEDHNIKYVATTIDRSESAIDARIRGLKAKMGKQTLHGLVASAIRGRLIDLIPPEFSVAQ